MLTDGATLESMTVDEVDLGRRRALGIIGGALVWAGLPPVKAGVAVDAETAPRVCLALGSGGARGLAHLLAFEVLDDLGLRPAKIAGSSAGAVMGALYASGMTAAEIRALLEELLKSRDEGWFMARIASVWERWVRFIDPTREPGGLLESTALVRHLASVTGVERFEDLDVPLQVVATDYWARRSVVLESGALWPAVQASMAMPGLFAPVRIDGRVLVDGGLTNPVPFDGFGADCDAVVAVDVLGVRTPNDGHPGVGPSYFDNSFNTFQIMQYAILEEKLRQGRPDFLLSPEIRDVRVLDFHRYDEILEQARPATEAFRRELLDRYPELDAARS